MTDNNTQHQNVTTPASPQEQIPLNNSFLESFQDADLKSNPSLKDFKDVEALAKSYINAQKLIGADKVVLPKEDADVKEWQEFYNKLGRPEDATGYDIKVPDEIKPGLFYDKELITGFSKTIHELGLSKKQGEAMYAWYNQQMEAKAEELNLVFKQQQEQVVEDLKKTWGPKYEIEVAKAKSVIDKFSTPDFKEYLDTTGLGNDINLIKFMNTVAKAISEDSFKPEGTQSPGFTANNQSEALTQIDNMRNNKDIVAILKNPSHPKYKEHNEKMRSLYAIAYPETQ